jgi:farnesyl diphosphate synthase
MLKPRENMPDLSRVRADLCARMDALFEALLPLPDGPHARLYLAIRHATIGGGKRLRPLLVVLSGRLFGVSEETALRAGLAVEAIHAHSLIHDDLPCMDDDDLRRGRPTVHKAYDEATAVLAGDSLLALAFEVLADPETHPDAAIRSELVVSLSRAAGAAGMAGGQMIDISSPSLTLDLAGVTQLQRLKTGALLAWSIEAGAILGRATDSSRRRLALFANCLGLIFQIADDLLDHEGEEARAGKRIGKDAAAGKQTFVSLLGAEGARAMARELLAEAVEHLAPFGAEAVLLSEVAEFALARDH